MSMSLVYGHRCSSPITLSLLTRLPLDKKIERWTSCVKQKRNLIYGIML